MRILIFKDRNRMGRDEALYFNISTSEQRQKVYLDILKYIFHVCGYEKLSLRNGGPPKNPNISLDKMATLSGDLRIMAEDAIRRYEVAKTKYETQVSIDKKIIQALDNNDEVLASAVVPLLKDYVDITETDVMDGFVVPRKRR